MPTGNTEALLRIELTEEEQEVLAHVNGRATIEQICQVSYLSNLETCRVLWALTVLGRRAPGPARGGGRPRGGDRRAASRSSTSRASSSASTRC